MHYLIFDFDGVLGDTRDASAKATALVEQVDYETAFTNNGIYARHKPRHVRNHTLSDEEMEAIRTWTSLFGDHMKESDFGLFENFIHEIELVDTKYKAVVSSGSEKYVIPALARTNIQPTHILAFEAHHSKEEKIETICKDWGIEVDEAYYFTDTLADIYELRDMLQPGKLIAVSWGYCAYEELAHELDPAYILKKPEDIHNVLRNHA
jgi:phosphoglycolate phosphatase-like HAD superfamily hydrolase